ncbi:hypothetical protein PENTCL1PPCAC_11430 [Pristionchus entomophagus]|uniref:WD repeat-containing protein 37 n=1 Tax=Pristionchus entomophagus TaxID=358040 RepID=A0AAV5T1B0_9BILA|nr:hypothetical protein PENTCL1PPCAC_11430 [Pristionchus entomophagus]
MNTPSISSAPHKRSQISDSELLSTHPSTYDLENEYPAHKARLYQLFTMIDKEYDRIYAENIALRARIGIAHTDPLTDIGILPSEVPLDGPKPGRKAMQMGQKLRTALGKRPPGRLVFKVGGGDSQRFRLENAFEGHRDGIWFVTSSGTHNIAVSASADQTCRVWTLDDGECTNVYTGHTGSVNCVSLSTSETLGDLCIASASGDESVHVWKIPQSGLSTERKEGNEEKEEEEITDIEERRLWSPLIRLTGHKGVISSCEWLSTSNQLVSGSWDRTANLYDVERGEILNVLTGHEMELTSTAAHPWQKLIATASKDCTFRMWDLREPMQSVAVLQAHEDTVTSVKFSNDKVISASDDRTLKVWDTRNMRTAYSNVRLSSPPNHFSVGSVNSLIAVPMDNSNVCIYDLNGQRLLHRRCHTRLATCTSWSDGSTLLTTGFDRLLISWKVSTKEKEEKA